MKLSELPTLLVERVERGSDGLHVYGRFDRLEGVREGGCFRLERWSYAWVNLFIQDTSSKMVTFTDARDPNVSKLRVGERYIWFDDYWQTPFVEAVADETTIWRRFSFETSDAQYFRHGDHVGWQKAGTPLPEGYLPTEIRPGGWDHEHCDLCSKHIDVDSPIAFTDYDGHFLCVTCYERYAVNHDVSFVVGA